MIGFDQLNRVQTNDDTTPRRWSRAIIGHAVMYFNSKINSINLNSLSSDVNIISKVYNIKWKSILPNFHLKSKINKIIYKSKGK